MDCQDAYNPGRFRVRTIAIAVAIFLIGASIWIHTFQAAPVRNFINRTLTSYDGCQCEDCAERYLPIAPPRSPGWCGTTANNIENQKLLTSYAAFGATSLCLLYAYHAPRAARRAIERAEARIYECPRCRYNIRGLIGHVGNCPECGESWRADPLFPDSAETQAPPT